MRKLFIFKAYIFFFLMACTQVSFGASRGIVKLNNYTSHELIIFVKTVDYYGYTRWREVERIAPRTYLQLRDVPGGTIIGAQTISKDITFKPVEVRFPEYNYFEINFR